MGASSFGLSISLQVLHIRSTDVDGRNFEQTYLVSSKIRDLHFRFFLSSPQSCVVQFEKSFISTSMNPLSSIDALIAALMLLGNPSSSIATSTSMNPLSSIDASVQLPPPLPEVSTWLSKPECIYPHCNRLPLSRHLCLKHGGGTCCSSDSCTEHVVSNGKCLAHGGRRCKESSCAREPNMCGKKCARKCIVEDCNSLIRSNNLCISHGGGPRCKADGCTTGVQSHGLCHRHGARCKVEGCMLGVYALGICYVHSMQVSHFLDR